MRDNLSTVRRARFHGRTAAILLYFCARALALNPSLDISQYAHHAWKNSEGFAKGAIECIAQTPDGYLWLGTQSGILRFDGVRFTPLENFYPNAPANMWVREIVEDRDHTLWIATNDAGLYKLSNGTVTQFSQKNGFPSDQVSCLVYSPKGEMWACTTDGMVRFTATASGLRLARDETGIFARAPIRFAGDVDLSTPARPFRFTFSHALLTAQGNGRAGAPLSTHLTLNAPNLKALGAAGGADIAGRAALDLDIATTDASYRIVAGGTIEAAGQSLFSRIAGPRARLLTSTGEIPNAGDEALESWDAALDSLIRACL